MPATAAASADLAPRRPSSRDNLLFLQLQEFGLIDGPCSDPRVIAAGIGRGYLLEPGRWIPAGMCQRGE